MCFTCRQEGCTGDPDPHHQRHLLDSDCDRNLGAPDFSVHCSLQEDQQTEGSFTLSLREDENLRSVYTYRVQFYPLLFFSIVSMLTVWITGKMDLTIGIITARTDQVNVLL